MKLVEAGIRERHREPLTSWKRNRSEGTVSVWQKYICSVSVDSS